jgi:hypothetical protein
MKPTRAALAVPLLLLATACEGKPPAGGAAAGEPHADPVVITLENGLSAAEREGFYHRAEGSEVIPYAWVRAVHSMSTGKPFLEEPERFGLIADPNNPDGLPIGLTAATTVDTRLFGVRMTGINCAACHVNEIRYRGSRMIVDGGPATFEADSFGSDLSGSLKATLHDPRELLAFLWRLRRGDEPRNPHFPPAAGEATERVVRAVEDLHAAARDDASAAQMLVWAEHAIEQELARPPVDMLVGLTVAPPDSGPGARPRGAPAPAPASLPAELTYASARAAAAAIVADSVAAHPALLGDARAGAPAAARAEEFIADVILTYRLIKARLHAFRRIAPHVQVTPNGWGRVDAFGAARNILYPRDSTQMTAPVSYPWLWGFGEQRWFHYDGNTNSVMQRNLGQALGVGAAYDSLTRISTLNPWAIHWLEHTARKLTAPRWPEEVLGAIDRTKAAEGQKLYAQLCSSCHDDPATERLFDPDSIGTDRNRLENFAAPMKTGGVFTDSAGPFLADIERQAYRIWNVPADSQTRFSGPQPSVWRTTSRWIARPLAGVWATAPYLHNGSVPTLHDLLLPPGERPKTFPLGHREYDPVKVGYATDVASPREVFDTQVSGNRNVGHEFGTRLTPAERAALLEYLKTI